MESNNQQIVGQIASSPYAPGYRFMPTDEELITEYLAKKVNNEPIPIADICEVNLYDHTPFYLAENFPRLGDNDYYFFTPRGSKVSEREPAQSSGREPRRVLEGNWGRQSNHHQNRRSDWRKKVLVYYIGKPKAQPANKTDWIMHEFRLNAPPKTPNKKDMRLDDWVLCRIRRKSGKGDKKLKDCEENAKENVALDNNNNNNNHNVENAIDQQNQESGAMMMMFEGGQNESQQISQQSYFQEGYNQGVRNYEYVDPLLSLAGTSELEEQGMDFSDFNSGGVFGFEPQLGELVWGGGFDGTLMGNQGTGNGAFDFPQQQCPFAPPPPDDVGLKKFADDFVRDEKAGLSKDDAGNEKIAS